ncbi:ATP-binding cassette domain-containing protein [Enterocloster citroniae]|uniref:ABC transporter ATP-binding protein n=1 Tax=Enterocloster citroniae TaxID=358743 RepID=UPI0032C0F499
MLEVRNVYKSFEVSGTDHMVLDDLSFTVQDRDFYIILGQSGCGKSTLLRMIGGFNKPGKGEILLDGRAVSGPSKDMMMVFQSFDQLFPWFTLKGNLVYALKKAGILPEGNDYGQCAVRYLTMAGLEEFQDSYPHQLSGGMKQRGALARALCLRPRLLLMDEPFSSLDYMTKQGLYKSIREMADQTEATVVMVTHDIEEALVLGTSIGVLSPETGRFAGVWNRGAEGFAPETRNGLEACL